MIELLVYQLASTNTETLGCYRDELYACTFLSGLCLKLANMIRCQVLSGSRVLSMDENFFVALRVQESVRVVHLGNCGLPSLLASIAGKLLIP